MTSEGFKFRRWIDTFAHMCDLLEAIIHGHFCRTPNPMENRLAELVSSNYNEEVFQMTKRIIAISLTIIIIFSCMVLPASADTSNYGTDTKSITVVTKANWCYPGSESITLSQSKGIFSYAKTSWFGKVTGKTCTKSEYSTWRISVAATDGSHSYSRTWKNGSIKLPLKSNRTYNITVSYDSYQDTFRGLNYRHFRWTRYPSWRVSGTWKVSEYS